MIGLKVILIVIGLNYLGIGGDYMYPDNQQRGWAILQPNTIDEYMNQP